MNYFQRPLETKIVRLQAENEIPRGEVHSVTFGDGIYKVQAVEFANRLENYHTETMFTASHPLTSILTSTGQILTSFNNPGGLDTGFGSPIFAVAFGRILNTVMYWYIWTEVSH